MRYCLARQVAGLRRRRCPGTPAVVPRRRTSSSVGTQGNRAPRHRNGSAQRGATDRGQPVNCSLRQLAPRLVAFVQRELLTAHAVRHAVQGTGGAAKLADGKVPVRDSFAARRLRSTAGATGTVCRLPCPAGGGCAVHAISSRRCAVLDAAAAGDIEMLWFCARCR